MMKFWITLWCWLIVCLNLQAHTGGWDATVSGPETFYPTIQDARGNILGAYDPASDSVLWNKARVTAYGSIPEHRPRSLGEGVSLWESGSRQGRFPELSGLINYGWRYYQPMGGNFISPDLVYDPNNQSDFSFAGGDPINYTDPNGLFGKPTGGGTFQDRYLAQMVGMGYSVNGALAEQAYIREFVYGGWQVQDSQPSYATGGGFNLGSFAADAVLNADLLQQSWHELRTPDFSTGWGRAAFGVAAVGIVAGAVDAAANMATLGGKSLLTGGVKAGAKEIAEGAVKQIPNPAAGEDLFVGLYRQSRNANIQSGLNATHTPHHVVQDAVSGTSRNLGVTINIRKDLHVLTRTYGRNADLGSNVRNLAADVRDLRNKLRDAGYDRSLVNQQMQRLLELNRQAGNVP